VEELILLALEKKIDKDEAIAYILNFAITKKLVNRGATTDSGRAIAGVRQLWGAQ